MFYTPPLDGMVWGTDLPKSPVMLNPFRGVQPMNVFVGPTGQVVRRNACPRNVGLFIEKVRTFLVSSVAFEVML